MMDCPVCDGAKKIDAPHPEYGSRTCPEAYVEVACYYCNGEGKVRVETNFWAKPIPVRFYDWSAVDPDTYDGPGSPIGCGSTEQEAIDDLRQQLQVNE